MNKTNYALQDLIFQSLIARVPVSLGSIHAQHEQYARQLIFIIISHTREISNYQERIAFTKEVYANDTSPSGVRRTNRKLGQLKRHLRNHQSNLSFGISRFKSFRDTNPELGQTMLLILQEFGVNVDVSQAEIPA